MPSGELTLLFRAIRVPLTRSRVESVRFVELVLAGGLADTAGVLLALIWTAGFLPSFLEPASTSVLLAKPAPRWLLLAGKFLGVLVFVALQALIFVGVTWLALGVRTGIWEGRYFLGVPLLLAHFAMFFSISTLLAVLTRSTAAGVIGTLGFWVACWCVNYARQSAESPRRIARKRLLVAAQASRSGRFAHRSSRCSKLVRPGFGARGDSSVRQSATGVHLGHLIYRSARCLCGRRPPAESGGVLNSAVLYLDTNGGLHTVPLNGSLVLNANSLLKLAGNAAQDYAAAKPYPHIVLDHVLPADALDRVITDFPTPDNPVWKQYKSQYEGKLETQGEGHLSAFTSLFLYQLNSAPFLRFLEELTGIQALLPDPYFVGGGLHQIPRGGRLGIHADFHRHTKFPLEHRLNALIYLNKDWKDEYGGHLELWDRDMKTCAQNRAALQPHGGLYDHRLGISRSSRSAAMPGENDSQIDGDLLFHGRPTRRRSQA